MTGKEAFELINQHHPTLGGTEIILYLNNAIKHFCRKTEILKQSYSQTSTAGTRYYTLDPTIIKIISVSVDDVDIPRMIGKPPIEDDELADDGTTANNLGAPGSVSNERMFYVDLDRLGIVEKRTSATVRDDITSNYQSISETGLIIRIKCIAGPETDFSTHNIQTKTSGSILGDASGNASFDNYVLDYAIAEGYRSPASFDIQRAEYFESRFEKGIKEAKRFARSSYISTGRISPVDF